MEVINLSKNQFANLSRFELPASVFNTEAQMYEIQMKRKNYILKRLYNDEGPIFANKLYTLEMLNANKDYIPDTFVIPEHLVSVQQKLIGFTTPRITGINLQQILDDPKIDKKEKIYLLKRIGEILENMKNVRRYSPLKDFYINDLHESNFVVNTQKKQLHVVDTDSCKIAKNLAFCSRYLSPFSLFSKLDKSKYHVIDTLNAGGYIEPSEDSDLYCYTIMILNFLYDDNINSASLPEFYEYLTYLSDIGIDKELIDIFSNLITFKPNKNPMHLLDSLSYEQMGKAQKPVYSLKLKN